MRRRVASYLCVGMAVGSMAVGPAFAQDALTPDGPTPPPAHTHSTLSSGHVAPSTLAGSTPCPGDCDGNGVVDFNDLVTMLFEFGADPTLAGCDADANGVVDFNDLVTTLFLFGPCPEDTVFIPIQSAFDLFASLEALAATVQLGQPDPLGGRLVLEQFRDDFIPTMMHIVDIELVALDLVAFQPFQVRGEQELIAELDGLLQTMTDQELHDLVYIEADMISHTDVFQLVGPDLFVQLQSDAVGGYVPLGSFGLGWLWDWAISLAECVSKGVFALILKLIAALHGLLHSDTSLVSIADPMPSLALLSGFSNLVVTAQGAPDGGRQVIMAVRDQMIPAALMTVENELMLLGQPQTIPMAQIGAMEAQVAANNLLLLPDPLLNDIVYGDPAILPAAETVLLAEADIAALLNVNASASLSEWLWSTILAFIDCIPDVGEILRKLLGTGHDVAHSTNPTSADPFVFGILDGLSNTIVALQGQPDRGRQLALYGRDVYLPQIGNLMDNKLTMMGHPELIPAAQYGIQAQQDRLTQALLLPDPQLNQEIYDNRPDVQLFGDAWVNTISPLGVNAALSDKVIWNGIMRLLKCLNEEDKDKVAWVLEKIHGLLH